MRPWAAGCPIPLCFGPLTGHTRHTLVTVTSRLIQVTLMEGASCIASNFYKFATLIISVLKFASLRAPRSVSDRLLIFGSGHDLTVCGFEPHTGLCAHSMEPAWDPVCLSTPPLLALSLKNKYFKKSFFHHSCGFCHFKILIRKSWKACEQLVHLRRLMVCIC